ncbi:hypothetical protein D9613_004337 [Agrocybe pediades]|uniref:Uncharacterized protein n=1 Tax=Agrocybe pediades TaxID=84607 RepID=A0A8H4VKM5_9AGAR|nr:hypothetical protein D9613_004337 [Agrocybe pediades]
MPSVRPLLLLTFCGIFTLALSWRLYPDTLSVLFQPFLNPSSLFQNQESTIMSQDDPNSPLTNTPTPQWSSQFSGYLSRATPHPDPKSFIPDRQALELAVLVNAPVVHSGFTFALFSDRTFIDHEGKVYTLTHEDYQGLYDLGKRVANLPNTGGFRDQWRVKQERTCYPIDRILVTKSQLSKVPAEDYEQEFTEASVYGYDKTKTKLSSPVGGYTHLAPSLYELLGLAQEARHNGISEDQDVLQKVRGALGNVF